MLTFSLMEEESIYPFFLLNFSLSFPSNLIEKRMGSEAQVMEIFERYMFERKKEENKEIKENEETVMYGMGIDGKMK